MNFLSDVAGEQSAVAVYDIGKLQFLYVTYLPSARSALWQTRSKFETRNAGGIDFYVRRDSESLREFAFAVSGDYLLLATREDLMAGALQLLAGKGAASLETDSWFEQATNAAEQVGDLRLVMNMQSLVPNGYFRTNFGIYCRRTTTVIPSYRYFIIFGSSRKPSGNYCL